jgi:hypothetical protein
VEHLLVSGALTDLALGVIVLEAFLLVVARHRLGVGLRPGDVLGQLLAGAMLLLALRSALTGGSYLWTLGFVSASFPAHLFDLARRARQGRSSVERAGG